MRNVEISEEQGDHRNKHANEQTSQYAARHMPDNDRCVGHRRNQHFLDVLTELGPKERRHDIAIGVRDNGHHDQAWRDVLHVIETVHNTDTATDQVAENDEVQGHRDGGRNNGLYPDAQHTRHLLADNGLRSDEIQGKVHASAPFFSTRRMNISSRRLVLFLRLTI